MALVRQPKTAVFQAEIEVRIYRRPALKVLSILIKSLGAIQPFCNSLMRCPDSINQSNQRFAAKSIF